MSENPPISNTSYDKKSSSYSNRNQPVKNLLENSYEGGKKSTSKKMKPANH